jgi:hypothetical protein
VRGNVASLSVSVHNPRDTDQIRFMNHLTAILLLAVSPLLALAAEFHVTVQGDDAQDGSRRRPFRSLSAAARVAQPGDVITVHAGTYRECVTPPRGGLSDARRITYRAAAGERVFLKGSEIVRGWRLFKPGVWTVTLPNSFFGDYNPYRDLIKGDWFNDHRRPHHTGEVYLNGKSLWEMPQLDRVVNPRPVPGAADPDGSTWTWYCESDDAGITLYANFHDRNPNEQLVEINVRRTVFYPAAPGVNYLTVRGFHMSHAATQWAPPTAGQVGLIGTHWSRGWIIEDNVVTDSKCSGITLGKYSDQWDNTSANSAEGYVKTIERALANGWNPETIGHHIVRRNVISDCEQTGICGSLGAIFSQIHDNHIFNIWAKRQFSGAEMGGIKLHAAIDVVIRHNRIHDAGRALWMDWMAQGTRITGNLCYRNTTDDLFVEVNHGPFLVDHNLFLSGIGLQDWSQGGAYAHNLFTGKIVNRQELRRDTPYHPPHATVLAGLTNISGGDDRFYNNIFVGAGATNASGTGLAVYDVRERPLQTGGNLYLNGARPYARESQPAVFNGLNPLVRVREHDRQVWLDFAAGPELKTPTTVLVTTDLFGRTAVAGLPYVNPHGSPLVLDRDYLDTKRKSAAPAVGPFEKLGRGVVKIRVW